MRLINNRGDTIVEVMIALAVLAAILSGGYAIATRSLNGVRIAQERSEATKIAEGQLEAIRQKFSVNKSLSDLNSPVTGDPPIGFDASWHVLNPTIPLIAFCIKDDGSAKAFVGDRNDFSIYPPECIQGYYHIYITTGLQLYKYDTVDPKEDVKGLTYKVYISWERSGGNGIETLDLQNRLVMVK